MSRDLRSSHSGRSHAFSLVLCRRVLFHIRRVHRRSRRRAVITPIVQRSQCCIGRGGRSLRRGTPRSPRGSRGAPRRRPCLRRGGEVGESHRCARCTARARRCVLAPGPVILRGPDAARGVLSANPANALSKWSWTAIRVHVSGDGKEGCTMGYSELTQPSGTVLPGRYVAYWAKQADGTWKVEAYKRIPRAAGAVSLTPPPGFETPETKHRRYFPNTDASAEADAVSATDRAFNDLAQVVGNAESFARYAAPTGAQSGNSESVGWVFGPSAIGAAHTCLLYTSDAADERSSVD